MRSSHNLPRYEATELAGQLADVTWPGCYPLFYVERDVSGRESVVCPPCARITDNDADRDEVIVAADANYEDDALHCDACGVKIETAYADT
jgi:hypothetical protein